MFCSDKDFKKLFDDGTITIETQTDDDIRTSSVDLRISNIISVLSNSNATINVESSFEDIKQNYNQVNIGSQYYTLKPGESVIASTNKIKLGLGYIAMVVNRNSLIRLGITIPTSIVNQGYQGILPVFITNNSGFNFQFKAGDKLCQLIAAKTGEVDNPYYARTDSKYSNSADLISRFNQDK